MSTLHYYENLFKKAVYSENKKKKTYLSSFNNYAAPSGEIEM